MLSGNRNFEGRINPEVRANYLASPPLVVAYALAGRIDIDLTTEPLGTGTDGKPVFLKDIWPTPAGGRRRPIAQSVAAGDVQEELRRRLRRATSTGKRSTCPTGDLYAWDADSTYVKHPPYFDGMPAGAGAASPTSRARASSRVLGDSITTDHISPAGLDQDGQPGRAVPHRARRRSRGLQLLRRRAAATTR